MLINTILFYFFSSFLLLSALLVIFSQNPIFSVLFLILAFFNVSGLLFMINIEFLPIAFIVIYVGAVAVLFLFVLMMLNIKLAELFETNTNFYPVAFLFLSLFVAELFIIMLFEFESIELFQRNSLFFLSDFLNMQVANLNFTNFFELRNNLTSISYALFVKYFFEFLISGLILLLAMIGTIVLTLQKRFINKTQNIYYQVLRDYNKSIISFN